MEGVGKSFLPDRWKLVCLLKPKQKNQNHLVILFPQTRVTQTLFLCFEYFYSRLLAQSHAEDEAVPSLEAGGSEGAGGWGHRVECLRIPAASREARGPTAEGKGGAPGQRGNDDSEGHGAGGAEGCRDGRQGSRDARCPGWGPWARSQGEVVAVRLMLHISTSAILSNQNLNRNLRPNLRTWRKISTVKSTRSRRRSWTPIRPSLGLKRPLSSLRQPAFRIQQKIWILVQRRENLQLYNRSHKRTSWISAPPRYVGEMCRPAIMITGAAHSGRLFCCPLITGFSLVRRASLRWRCLQRWRRAVVTPSASHPCAPLCPS